MGFFNNMVNKLKGPTEEEIAAQRKQERLNSVMSSIEVSEAGGHETLKYSAGYQHSIKIITGDQPLGITKEELAQMIIDGQDIESPEFRNKITQNGGTIEIAKGSELIFDSPQFTFTHNYYSEVYFKEYNMTYQCTNFKELKEGISDISAEELKDDIIKRTARDEGEIHLTDGESEIRIYRKEQNYISIACDEIVSLTDIGQEGAASKISSITGDLVMKQSVGENISGQLKDGYNCEFGVDTEGIYKYPSGKIEIVGKEAYVSVATDYGPEEYPVSTDLTLMDTKEGLIVITKTYTGNEAGIYSEDDDKTLLIKGITSREFLENLNDEYNHLSYHTYGREICDTVNGVVSKINEKDIQQLTPEKAEEMIKEAEENGIEQDGLDR